MSFSPLPALGSTAWYPWATDVHNALNNSTPITNPLFAGTVALPGGAAGNPRLPVNGNVVIDGATARSGVGDKVAYAFTSTIRGGFTGDSGGNPTFVWGANDFLITGTTAGDVAGLQNITARETEVHMATPGANVGKITGLQVDAGLTSAATGATVGVVTGIYVSALTNGAGTVSQAYGVYIENPVTGAATNEALHIVGKTSMVGNLDVNGTTHLGGALTQDSGASQFSAIFSGSLSQTSSRGVYLGSGGTTDAGIHMADGAHAWTITNDNGTLRWLQTNVAEVATLDFSGNLLLHGGLSFSPATTTTAPSAGGAGALPATPAGYMTITVGGTARKVAYY